MTLELILLIIILLIINCILCENVINNRNIENEPNQLFSIQISTGSSLHMANSIESINECPEGLFYLNGTVQDSCIGCIPTTSSYYEKFAGHDNICTRDSYCHNDKYRCVPLKSHILFYASCENNTMCDTQNKLHCILKKCQSCLPGARIGNFDCEDGVWIYHTNYERVSIMWKFVWILVAIIGIIRIWLIGGCWIFQFGFLLIRQMKRRERLLKRSKMRNRRIKEVTTHFGFRY